MILLQLRRLNADAQLAVTVLPLLWARSSCQFADVCRGHHHVTQTREKSYEHRRQLFRQEASEANLRRMSRASYEYKLLPFRAWCRHLRQPARDLNIVMGDSAKRAERRCLPRLPANHPAVGRLGWTCRFARASSQLLKKHNRHADGDCLSVLRAWLSLKSISCDHTALDSIAICIASESYFPASHI